MRSRCSTWLCLCLLCVACAGGVPPAPPTRPAAATPTTAGLVSTATPAPDLAPATPPAARPTPAPTVAAASTVTATAGLITPSNALSLTQLAVLPTGKLDQVAWAPDGASLAAAGSGGVTFYNASTLSPTHTLPIGQWATSLAFDPAGRSLAVGTVGAIVQVWNLERLEPTTLLLGPGVQVQQVAYQPAGAVLASLGVDNRAHLWYVDGQQYLRGLGTSTRPAHALAFSPDGEWLATAEADRVLLWVVDLALAFAEPTPRTLPPPAGQPGAVTAVAFSPSGGQLAVAHAGGRLDLWDPAATTPALSLPRLNAAALGLAYSPDGALLASAHQDRALRLWHTASGQLLTTLPGHTDVLTSLAFSPDGTQLASSSWDGTVRLWGLPVLDSVP